MTNREAFEVWWSGDTVANPDFLLEQETAWVVWQAATERAVELCEALERERIKALEQLVIDAAYTLDKARIWNGMGWTYNPLHPVHYAPMRERLSNECDNIEAAIRKEARNEDV
jgi:hypothetical protein